MTLWIPLCTWGGKLEGIQIGPYTVTPQAELRPFSTDGCSMSPDGFNRRNPQWVACCIQHDIRYWIGGTRAQKNAADLELKQCIHSRGFASIAQIYFQAVSQFGGPAAPTRFRWGYGWNQMRGYKRLKPKEIQMAEELYGQGLAMLFHQLEKGQFQIRNDLNFLEVVPESLNEEEEAIHSYLRQNLTSVHKVLEEIRDEKSDSSEYLLKTDKCRDGISITVNKAKANQIAVRSNCDL